MVMTATPSVSVATSKPRCCPLIIGSPSPHIDRPRLNHFVSPHHVHCFVIGDGGIDVSRLELHPLSHLYRRAGSKRRVLVGAEPDLAYRVVPQRRIAVVHTLRLQ